MKVDKLKIISFLQPALRLREFRNTYEILVGKPER
jgi:hypothetical protein